MPDISDPAIDKTTLSKGDHASRVSIGKDAEGEAHSQKMETISDTSSQRALRQIDSFEIEKLPQKVILLKPQNPETHEGTLMLQHNEAVFMVRRNILERAKLFWKEAKDLNTNYALGITCVKQRLLDEAYEKKCIESLGF